MRRFLPIAAAVVAVLLLVSAVPVVADHGGPNDPQSGPNSACVDFLVLWAVGPQAEPTKARVEVDNGTTFMLSQSGGGDTARAYVDFYTSDDSWISLGSGQGQVPDSAAYGLICVGLTGVGWPAEVPAPGATWTYQDGFLHLDNCESPFC